VTAPVRPAALGVDALESMLGDPYDEANPCGFASIVAADEAGARERPGQRLLDAYGLAAEFRTPAAGGRLVRLDQLVEVVRVVSRRDPVLAARYGTGPFSVELVRAGSLTGALDTGLRVAIRHLKARRLYGRAAIDLPYLRSALAGAFVDLLVAECFVAVAARAAHLLPGQAGSFLWAAQTLVPRLMKGAMDTLSVVLGSRFYIRVGEHAVFQLLLRDNQAAGLSVTAEAAHRTALPGLPDLPALAGLAWRADGPVPPELFRPGAELPPLALDRIVAGWPQPGGAAYGSGGQLETDAATLGADPDVGPLAARAVARAHELTTRWAELPADRPLLGASPETHDLAREYVITIAAGLCIQTWRRSEDTFLADPAWLVAALHRLSGLTGTRSVLVPEHAERRVVDELLDRYAAHRGFGLSGRPLPDRP
jgi:hypothetical protein